LENTISDLRIELGRLRGIIDNLKVEAKKQKIDRNECKHQLFELKTIFQSFRQHFADLLRLSVQQTRPKEMNVPALMLVMSQTFQQQDLEKALDGLAMKINSLATYELDNPQYHDDTKIKNSIYDIVGNLELAARICDSKVFAPLGNPTDSVSKIAMFVARKQFGLDDKWALAACYLSAIDIVVNKKRGELGLVKYPEKDGSISFNDRFDQLVKAIESKHGELNTINKQLPKSFWKIRTDVIHYGYAPSQDELNLIVDWSQKIIDSLAVD